MPGIDLKPYQPIAVKQRSAQSDSQRLLTLLNRDISFGRGALSDKKKEALYQELSSLLKAGVDMKSSLELIFADQEKNKDRVLYEKIQAAVLAGSTLSLALKDTGKFSAYEIFSLQIGEESGKITEVLQNLASYYSNKIAQRRKIISALTYPMVVMMTSLGAVFFMLKFVVPMFGDVFKRFGGQLPWLTQKIIDMAAFMENKAWMFGLLIIALFALWLSARKKTRYQRITASFVLRIPLAGNIVRKIYLARFCNAMRLLIDARLPLLQAIALVRQMIEYQPISSSLQEVEIDIEQGKNLHESMGRFSIYPAKMIQMIKVGEETNRLEYFFQWIGNQYIEEVEYQTATISSTMEPLIIIFLGLIVGVILVSMYLPLFQMSNSFQ